MMELLAAIFSAAGVWLTAQRNMLGWPISLLATGFYGWVFFHAHLYADTALQGVFSLTILYGWALWALEKNRHTSPHAGLHTRSCHGLHADMAARLPGWLYHAGTSSPRGEASPRPFPWVDSFSNVANDNRPAAIPPAESLPARPLPPIRAILEVLVFAILSALWIEALRRWSDDPTPLLDGGLSGASLLAQLWTARRHRISWLLWSGIDVIYTGLFLNRALGITALLYGGYTLLGLYGYWKWRR